MQVGILLAALIGFPLSTVAEEVDVGVLEQLYFVRLSLLRYRVVDLAQNVTKSLGQGRFALDLSTIAH